MQMKCIAWPHQEKGIMILMILGSFIQGKKTDAPFNRFVLNKTQTISYKWHIKTRLSRDVSYQRTGVSSCS